eukprot:175130-Amphidinium_carterae.1
MKKFCAGGGGGGTTCSLCHGLADPCPVACCLPCGLLQSHIFTMKRVVLMSHSWLKMLAPGSGL